MSKQDLPIFWLKILSKVISFLSARYFCITLRILKEKSDTFSTITACVMRTIPTKENRWMSYLKGIGLTRDPLLASRTAWMASSTLAGNITAPAIIISWDLRPTVHGEIHPQKNNLNIWGKFPLNTTTSQNIHSHACTPKTNSAPWLMSFFLKQKLKFPGCMINILTNQISAHQQ